MDQHCRYIKVAWMNTTDIYEFPRDGMPCRIRPQPLGPMGNKDTPDPRVAELAQQIDRAVKAFGEGLAEVSISTLVAGGRTGRIDWLDIDRGEGVRVGRTDPLYRAVYGVMGEVIQKYLSPLPWAHNPKIVPEGYV